MLAPKRTKVKALLAAFRPDGWLYEVGRRLRSQLAMAGNHRDYMEVAG